MADQTTMLGASNLEIYTDDMNVAHSYQKSPMEELINSNRNQKYTLRHDQ